MGRRRHSLFEEEVLVLLNKINHKVNFLMANMQDVINEVQDQDTVIDSVVSLLSNISDQLKNVQASNDPTALQSIIDHIDANTKKLSDAVVANTPAQTSPQQAEPIQASNA